MPLIANSALPTFNRLRQEGQEVLPEGRAKSQDIRELHIGLLNMMPDAALQATERQFLRMVGACNRIAQFHVHPFTFPEIPRGEAAKEHIEKYYRSFDELKLEGLDALILSGANPAQPDITQEPFWKPLEEVVHWAKENVCSVMCSCLATHAIVQQLWGIKRYPLPRKRWGVYSNRLTTEAHPLTSNINTRFDAPHSHVYEVNSEQFRRNGLKVLAESAESDLHLGVSPDGFRFIFFQGHPEYDAISLLKEYRREVDRFVDGTRKDYPPYPEGYLDSRAKSVLTVFEKELGTESGNPEKLDMFPEAEITELVDNTWSDTGKAIVNNWLGLVYQVADSDRSKVFMDGIDPEDPLGIYK
ncbi:MAG: homoserine O-succinyltransferase [Gammaproteobacteria bacterium]|nr:homoserine O-succinyltransferase [Gammaproteobacteria bacterium]NKB63989.1 homoserine O-succinyltransferase [Gammaproteobacteria bacterium]